MEKIIKEVSLLYSSLDKLKVDTFISEIASCKGKIIGLGAGRMGYSIQAFIMRLSHLGFETYMIGDTSIPKIGKNDLVIVNSSSGETKTIVLLAKIAKESGAQVNVLTGNLNSTLANISDTCLNYTPIKSDQLMKTVYEQFSFLFFDYCSLELTKIGGLKLDEIEINHSILE